MELTDSRRMSAAQVINGYYGAWQEGSESFDEERLALLLAEDLEFEGPIAGRRRGAGGFIGGLRRFVEGLQAPINVLQQDLGDAGGAVLYDARLPKGSMRFAEFFEVEGGRIRRLLLLYDAERYRALGGR